MQTFEQANKDAADLYWLAFLLTGDRGVSLDVALEATDFSDLSKFSDDTSSFLSALMRSWTRRLVIARALDAIRGELAASVCRTAARRSGKVISQLQHWVPGGDATKEQLESALLKIDVFPRCALVLSMFEKVSLKSVIVLLNADRDLIGKAQSIALQELARNLARAQGNTSHVARQHGVEKRELQHA